MHADINDDCRALDERRANRERRHVGEIHTARCPSCRLFVRNPNARCSHCGYDRHTGWLA